MLSQMFEKFNFIVIAAGVIIMSYVGIVSAVNTAREGQAMGSKFSLWVPLRGLTGMLLMIPAPGTGYSVIQMTVIWIVLNGIGAADAIWNVVLSQVSKGVAAVGTVNIPSNLAQSLVGPVMTSATCMATLNQLKPPISGTLGQVKLIVQTGTPSTIPNTQNPTQLSQSATISVGYASSNNPSVPDTTYGTICGRYNVSAFVCSPTGGGCPDSFNFASLAQRLNIKVLALVSMFDAINPMATTIANQAKLDATNAPGAGQNPTSSIPPGFAQAAQSAYNAGFAQLAGGVNLSVNQSPGSYSSFNPIGGGGFGFTTNPLQGGAQGGGQVPPGTPTSDQGQGGQPTTSEEYLYNEGANAYNTVANAAQSGYNTTANGVDTAWDTGSQMEAWAFNPLSDARWQQNPSLNAGNSQIQQLQQFGWVHAGGYYFVLIQSTNSNPLGNDTSTAGPSGVPSPVSSGGGYNFQTPPVGNQWSTGLFNALNTPQNRIAFNNALTYQSGYSTAAPAASLPSIGPISRSSGSDIIDSILGYLTSNISQPIMDFVLNNMTGNQTISGTGPDPLQTIGGFGWNLMTAGESAVFAIIAGGMLIMAGGAIGACLSPGFAVLISAFAQIYTLCFTVIVMLWTAGATMGIYTPLVPYIIFTSSAIGWFIAVSEALVGAPIIALALTHPSPEELPGGLKASLGILANIFLRPTLMIFGFVVAGSVIRAAIIYINFGFAATVKSSTTPTFFSFVPLIGIYTMLVLGVINLGFQLIYEYPAKILGYMGVRDTAGPDTKELIGKAETGFKGGAEIGQQGLQGSFDAAKGRMQSGVESAAKVGQSARRRWAPGWWGSAS